MNKLYGIVFMFLWTYCGGLLAQTVDGGEMEERNRKLARDFYTALYSKENSAALSFVAKTFVEHQISAAYSLDGLLKYAKDRVTKNQDHYFILHRSIAQGDFVFFHIEERLTPSDSIARGELFKFSKDGKIVEHWGAEQQAISLGNNQNGFFSGSEVNRSSSSGRRFAKSIMESDAELFRNLDVDLIYKTRTNRYIQHNQGASNGPDGLRGFIEAMKGEGCKLEVIVEQVLAEGDYVVGLNYFKTTPRFPGFGEVVVFDLIRVTEDGKSDEHWDVIQELEGEPLSKVF